MTLNAKQQRFADEYLVDRNATQAAIRAGYSAKTAGSQGQRFLKAPEIRAAIEIGEAERKKRTEITADWVLHRLKMLADGDIRRLYDANGELLNPADLDDETAYAVASVEVVTEQKGRGIVEHTAKMKLSDKRAALVDIGRHLGMFKDKVDVEHSGGVTVILNGDDAAL